MTAVNRHTRDSELIKAFTHEDFFNALAWAGMRWHARWLYIQAWWTEMSFTRQHQYSFQNDLRAGDGKTFLKLHIINLEFQRNTERLEHAVAEQPYSLPNCLWPVRNHNSIWVTSSAIDFLKHPEKIKQGKQLNR